MQKENPNPVVHSTHKRSYPSAAAHCIGSGAIHRYSLGAPSPFDSQTHKVSPASDFNDIPPSEGLSLSSITAEDRSVALALSAAAYPSAYPSSNPSAPSATGGDSEESPELDVLQQAGFALFNPQRIQKQCRAIRYPSYAPSIYQAEQEDTSEDGPKRDAITANEVFDIIRNIQDPEHPLTLEQLNVTRLELIDVVDLKGENGDGKHPIQTNGYSPRRFSTVHVQFTPTVSFSLLFYNTQP